MFSNEAVIDLMPVPAAVGLRRERDLSERLGVVAARVSRTNVIGVCGPYGGSGKTRTTYVLGAALAQVAGLNVVAVDLDDDYGALRDLVPEQTRSRARLTSTDGAPLPLPQLRQYLSVTASRMLVMEGPGDDLDAMLAALQNVDVVLLDCAAGMGRERVRWARNVADQLVVVARPEPSGSRSAAAAVAASLDGIEAACWLVVNRCRVRADTTVVEEAFSTVGALRRPFHLPESQRLARDLEHHRYSLPGMPWRVRTAILGLATEVGECLR